LEASLRYIVRYPLKKKKKYIYKSKDGGVKEAIHIQVKVVVV
jgi:hypothetical protein